MRPVSRRTATFTALLRHAPSVESAPSGSCVHQSLPRTDAAIRYKDWRSRFWLESSESADIECVRRWVSCAIARQPRSQPYSRDNSANWRAATPDLAPADRRSAAVSTSSQSGVAGSRSLIARRIPARRTHRSSRCCLCPPLLKEWGQSPDVSVAQSPDSTFERPNHYDQRLQRCLNVQPAINETRPKSACRVLPISAPRELPAPRLAAHASRRPPGGHGFPTEKCKSWDR